MTLGEYLRSAPVRQWALILGGPALTAMDGWLVWIIWRGGWPKELAPVQLETLGTLAFAHVVLLALPIVSLAAVSLDLTTKIGSLKVQGDD